MLRFIRYFLPAICTALLILTDCYASVRTDPLFFAGTLAANDDGSTALLPMGISINFLGTTYSNTYVNNNGNLTFTNSLSTFTPFPILSTGLPIIAPFFADVDTRGAGSGLVHYGTSTVGGRPAFAATWGDLSGAGVAPGVGYFPNAVDKLNEFQVVLIDRSDIGLGDFDIEFNYDQIQWETGGASGGSGGLGGNSARVGFSNGSSFAYEFPGSAANGAFLDGGPFSLTAGSNVGQPGRYVFSARNGGIIVNPPGGVPEPASVYVLAGLLLSSGALCWVRRRVWGNAER